MGFVQGGFVPVGFCPGCENLSINVKDNTLLDLWYENYTKLLHIIANRLICNKFTWIFDDLIIMLCEHFKKLTFQRMFCIRLKKS